MPEGTPGRPTVPQPNTLAPLDLRRMPSSLGGALPGYGLTPKSARERAAVVRAVTDDQQIRQRPMPVVLVTAVIALVGLGVFGWQLYALLSADPGAGAAPAVASPLLCDRPRDVRRRGGGLLLGMAAVRRQEGHRDVAGDRGAVAGGGRAHRDRPGRAQGRW